MLAFIAFPTLGKTFCALKYHIGDLDRGFIRKILGYGKNDYINRDVFNRLEMNVINFFKADGNRFIFMNDPLVVKETIDDVKFELVIPSYGKDEFLNRVKLRGDDPNSKWVQDIYQNFEIFLSEWQDIAEIYSVPITKAWRLSDLLGSRGLI